MIARDGDVALGYHQAGYQLAALMRIARAVPVALPLDTIL